MGKWFMYFIIAVVIVAMLKNAAGTVGIILAGGDFVKGETGLLTGGTPSSTKGTFTSSGGSTIKLG